MSKEIVDILTKLKGRLPQGHLDCDLSLVRQGEWSLVAEMLFSQVVDNDIQISLDEKDLLLSIGKIFGLDSDEISSMEMKSTIP